MSSARSLPHEGYTLPVPSIGAEGAASSFVEAAALQDMVVTVHTIRGDRRIGHGSGFIWKGSRDSTVPPGIVVTNHHVVSDSTPRSGLPESERNLELRFELELARNRRVPASVLIKDRLLDLALLQIGSTESEGLAFAIPPGIQSRASSVPARAARALNYANLGEPVIRIGSPGVYGESEPLVEGFRAAQDRIRELVTFGIVGGMEYPGSGPGRGTELLVTDAYASGGSSGGPVIALSDHSVVGVTSRKSYLRSAEFLEQLLEAIMIQSGLGDAEVANFFSNPTVVNMIGALRPSLDSIGLEIPAFWLDHLWSEYQHKGPETGYLKRASLGFDNEAESFVRVQLPIDPSALYGAQETGILLSETPAPNSPARAAGLRRGDLLFAFDDIPMEDPSSLIAALTPGTINQHLELDIIRDGTHEVLTVVPIEYRPKRFDDVN